MKKITDKWLNENDACPDAVKWILQQKKNDINYLFKECKKHKKYYWLNWGICKLLTKKQLIQYAIYAAKQVIHIFEKRFPNDKRPKKAINAAVKCIKNNTKKNQAAANAAANAANVAANTVYAANFANAANTAADVAANAAAYSANAAANATANAVYVAANAAAYSANAAANAAADAAVYAADAAVYAANAVYAVNAKLKILNFGFKLLTES